MSQRDTQFQGSAKALYNKLKDEGYTAENYDPDKSIYRDDVIEIIARWGYDLVEHAVNSFQAQVYQEPRSRHLKKYLSLFCQEVPWIDRIPDMAERPSEEG